MPPPWDLSPARLVAISMQAHSSANEHHYAHFYNKWGVKTVRWTLNGRTLPTAQDKHSPSTGQAQDSVKIEEEKMRMWEKPANWIWEEVQLPSVPVVNT